MLEGAIGEDFEDEEEEVEVRAKQCDIVDRNRHDNGLRREPERGGEFAGLVNALKLAFGSGREATRFVESQGGGQGYPIVPGGRRPG